MLTEGDASMKVVSIVGSAGKTTLAHAVYHHWARKPQFDCWAFVTAPLKSGMEELYTEMLSQLDMENLMKIDEEAKDEGQLISHIGEFLQNKRYLVVVDDLRNEEDWRNISRSLPNNSHRSRVITTTRFNDIAKLCSSVCDEWVYRIPHLKYPDSEKLFLRFFGSEVSWPNAPTDVLYIILKMCGGTPSAVISIASFLATEVTAAKPWQEMINSLNSAWKQTARVQTNIPGFEDLRRILALTYHHLPSDLKDCLLYLAVHAKNQMIYRTASVRKWIAEEFISEYGELSREEVASQYFDQLIERNFIHPTYLEEDIYQVNYVVLHILGLISQEINFAASSDVGISSGYGNSVRLLIQCSGSELAIHSEKMDIFGIRSITIVGPAKFHLFHALPFLRVLDLDGCKDFDNYDMGCICRMIRLKYLSIKHTLVNEIPPEIGELRYLETLDISQSKISNLPPEIGKLQQLKTLDASCTEIICVPRQIRKLKNLETLDVRQTQVKELPKEIVLLPKLAHLYFGQCSSPQGVKLPVGSQQLTSVKVLGTVDSREWSQSSMEDISGLKGVKELEIVLHDQPADKDQDDKLLSSIGKCDNLEYLIIHGDYDPGDCPTVKFCGLTRLKVEGRLMNAPQWIGQLSTLKKVDVQICKLEQDDLKILGGMPSLSTLALALICIPRNKQVAITSRLHSSTCTDLPPREECPAGFMCLEIFSFDCHVPWIAFGKGAMPKLKDLHLKLYASSPDKYPSGIINLDSIEKIILQTCKGSVMPVVDAMRKEASRHARPIIFSVNGNYEDLAAMREDSGGASIWRARADAWALMVHLFGSLKEKIGSVKSLFGQKLMNLATLRSCPGSMNELAPSLREEASSHGNLIQADNTRADITITATEIEEC